MKVPNLFKTADRKVLEGQIFPWVMATRKPRVVVSVGIDWYTLLYWKFFPGAAFITIDADAGKTKFAPNNPHIVGKAQELGDYFDASVDVVVFNGVYGWGCNTQADLRAALQAMHQALVPQGLMVFGFNDTEQFNPCKIGADHVFEGFEPVDGPGEFGRFHEVKDSHRHCFTYLQKV